VSVLKVRFELRAQRIDHGDDGDRNSGSDQTVLDGVGAQASGEVTLAESGD
jgi:hypothetical protein